MKKVSTGPSPLSKIYPIYLKWVRIKATLALRFPFNLLAAKKTCPMNKMVPKHLRPPVSFLPIETNGDKAFNKLISTLRDQIALAFMIPVDLLPLPSEKLDESMLNPST